MPGTVSMDSKRIRFRLSARLQKKQCYHISSILNYSVLEDDSTKGNICIFFVNVIFMEKQFTFIRLILVHLRVN